MAVRLLRHLCLLSVTIYIVWVNPKPRVTRKMPRLKNKECPTSLVQLLKHIKRGQDFLDRQQIKEGSGFSIFVHSDVKSKPDILSFTMTMMH